MKVLHLISGGDGGGAKTHVITLLKRLMKEGIDVELLCIMEGAFTEEAKNEGIPIKIIHQKRRYSLRPILDIKKYIANGGYDIVHCHGARANYIAFFIKNSLNIPFITTIHSDYKLDFKDSIYKQAIFMPINAIALRKFDYILAVTKSFKNMLIERGFDEKKLKVIYNGINMQKEIRPLDKKEFLKSYNIPYDESYLYVGIAARLQQVKGLKHFLEASKILLKEDKNIMFLIAGSGALEDNIKSFIKENNLQDNVKMLGFVKDINSFYNALDINVLTSYSESFPYALLEGARLKKATIATCVGGIPEMIKHNETGFLIKPSSSKDIAEKISILLKDKKLMSSFGESFYKYAYDHFSDEKMAKTHIDIYKNILKEENCE
ncbi:glycosyltransferase family 4 protein [uncultured Tyzzerella sp.]|uniref:glycosyltransferase family 4 protein n=1 Tax=uncultured Tyzzerella sp. TaxID=2321398 RepID=UPI0029436063|nr:glycosyltransferase family 4 protein [uncultured Tyzzerella sp.]